jgi:DNA-binding transcriptional regulator PaaX
VDEKQKEVAKNILLAIGIVGILSTVVIAPGLSKILPILSKVDPYRINQEIKRLQKRGLVEIIKRKNGITDLKITDGGKKKLAQYKIDNLKLEKSQKWDKKWRIVIFDIPIQKNISRNLLRKKIKNLGFYKLQKSVFVTPYECLAVVSFLRDYFGVNGEVEYIEAEKLESQDILIKHFFT